VDPNDHPVTRRGVLGGAAALATAIGTLELTGRLAWLPQRPACGATGTAQLVANPTASLPDIQFDLDRYIPPPTVIDGVRVRFGPIHTIFATATLATTPTTRDQRVLSDALTTIEQSYPYAPGGVMVHVAYGLPYFQRLPAGLFALYVPRLLADTNRFALEEAIPSPTDVHPSNPGISKLRFNVPVRIERNDLLFTIRGDNPAYLTDVLGWLAGSNTLAGRPTPSPRLDVRLTFTSTRAMFVQMGLPRIMAANNRAPYAFMIHPRSPMWMGFVDQQTEASAAAPVVTFRGANGIRLTTAQAGDYFDNGAIQHLAHDILDLQQFYDVDDDGNPGDDAAFTERVQYMFRLGHIATLQRSSRTADGRPLHQRIDGPGFDAMDVPGGARQPKLQFSIFVPTANLFATMRRHQASPDLPEQFNVDPNENGLERFITATRRQNFLIPPRRHRSFPLLELV
jgi:hypothetical protein